MGVLELTNFLTSSITDGIAEGSPGPFDNIIPSGFQSNISSDEEFTELTDFLGGASVAGGKMKDDVQWNGSNSSGFTGLPGGYRSSGGLQKGGFNGYWWTASESGSYSWVRTLSIYYDNVYRYDGNRFVGRSARCVRD